jgi:hypothetical protein
LQTTQTPLQAIHLGDDAGEQGALGGGEMAALVHGRQFLLREAVKFVGMRDVHLEAISCC